MRNILIFTGMLAFLFSCSDIWDTHYDKKMESGEVSDLTLYEYFQSETEYLSFFNMLKDANVDEELAKDQFMTVWAVRNANFDLSDIGNLDPTHVARYHTNYLAFGSTNLKNGLRIQTLNGVYLTIYDNGEGAFANESKIISSKRFKNGVVHEVEAVLVPLINMFDFITLLDDDHSIIRDSILNYNHQVFDRARSTPIGVDQTGNTIYDSLFYTSNPLFEKANFSSEFSQFTMFLPSNKVIEQCFSALANQYSLMGKPFTINDSILALNWIKEAIFHQGVIDNYGEILDINSPFGKVWRTTVQQVAADSRRALSNGVAYNVTYLKIPNNIIISRIKSLVWYYAHLDEQRQQELYAFNGVIRQRVFAGDAAPVAGLNPSHYWLMEVSGDPESEEEFSIEFPPLDWNEATGEVNVMKIPPGEYNLYMGFRSAGHPLLDFYFSSGDQPISDDLLPIATGVNVGNTNPWNYDRNNQTDASIHPRWNGLGGLVGVVNVEGEGMTSFRIKLRFNQVASIGAAKRMQIYHWALRPTVNNY